jgi:general secretion pathway protein D
MHVEVEISSVVSYVNLGGISQPVISQEKVIHDIRMKDGEVNLLGGLKQSQDSTTVSGIPGLSSIPVIKWLFSSKTVNKTSQELLIALIPHIVRRPDYTEEEMRPVFTGTSTVVKLNYAPRTPAGGEPAPKGGAGTPFPSGAPGNSAATTTSSSAPPPAPPVTAPQSNVPPSATTSTPATPPAAAPAPNASVTFEPAQVDQVMGQPFNVNLVMTNATDLFSAPLQIKYDPKMLKLNDVTQGNLMSSDGQQVTFTKNIQNDTGEADITLNRLPGTGGVTGSGILVTLSFTTLGRGTATVSAAAFSPSNSQGQPITNSSPLVTVNIR